MAVPPLLFFSYNSVLSSLPTYVLTYQAKQFSLLINQWKQQIDRRTTYITKWNILPRGLWKLVQLSLAVTDRCCFILLHESFLLSSLKACQVREEERTNQLEVRCDGLKENGHRGGNNRRRLFGIGMALLEEINHCKWALRSVMLNYTQYQSSLSVDQDSATCPGPWFPACYHASHHDYNELNLWNCW